MVAGSVMMPALVADMMGEEQANQYAPRKTHFSPKARRVIFINLSGGVSHLDTFDHKPQLYRDHGKEIAKGDHPEIQNRPGYERIFLKTPQWQFKRYGQCGKEVSSLFPEVARSVDDIAFINSMHTSHSNHYNATLGMHTGSFTVTRPSIGAWVSYGLGSANHNMPGYVVIQDPRGAPVNGAAIWSNGYLPAAHQGTLLRPSGTPILNLESPDGIGRIRQRREMDALQWLNRRHLAKRGGDSELEARISAYELAFRMQTEAPDLMNISGEPQHIRDLYGLDNGTTAGFGRQCLLARRMVESGVRHTLLVHGVQITNMSWDDHGDVKGGMIRHCSEVDRPVAGLLADLKQRGLLDETLVVWASEMGRTPFRNGGMSGNPGREHNSWALTMWMAGGDVKGGTTVGATDEFSLRGIGDTIHVRDVHATILDLMGLDQEAVNYQHAGRIRKLTDIGGRVLKDIVG